MPSTTTEPTRPLGLSAPERLCENHDTSQFDCGVESINTYLQGAIKEQERRNAAIYVTCLLNTNIVAGFYTLSNGSVARTTAPGPLSRNSSNPIPVTLLGRLGVDKRYQGRGAGLDLLKSAVSQAIVAADTVASRALILTALDDSLVDYYKRKAGFRELYPGTDDRALFIKL